MGFELSAPVSRLGLIVIAESMLGLDDDSDDDVFTARGQADQNLKQWTYQRDN